MQREIDKMLESGIIEPSQSEWLAPIVLVKKRNSTLHLCVDYCRLNSVSKSDAYPMPRIDDLIYQLGKAQYLTTLDLTKGYWQFPVSADVRHKFKPLLSPRLGCISSQLCRLGCKGLLQPSSI